MDPEFAAPHGPYAFTPLYGFASDADVLEFSKGVQICRYEDEKLELLLDEWDTVTNYLTVYPTEYLLQARPPKAKFDTQVTDANASGDLEFKMWVAEEWFRVSRDLVWALRLFEPGRFAMGPTWLCVPPGFPIDRGRNQELFGPAMCLSFEPSDEPILSVSHEVTYHFQAAELSSFKEFSACVSSALNELVKFPKLALAESRFNQSFGEKAREDEIVDIFVCLEALLLYESDELTLRLGTRLANLLGAGPEDRKKLFAEVKDFYGVRSKIVHGGTFKPKDRQLVQDAARLRELARRVLLCCMSLGLAVGLGPDFFKLLDEMSLDDNLRAKVQKKAFRLLHMRGRG